ncbi:MAG: Low specificity L-threonine aldolase [Desulfovibrio sp.]
MIRFECDYAEGAHEKILQRLAETNYEQTAGYGIDPYCASAAGHIRRECAAPEGDVHFLVGGTQANMVMIASVLRPHQGALAAESGHIAVHETGAIEAVGHKVLPLPSTDGKITADQVRAAYAGHWHDVTHEHMVQPGLVYISQPTENGTLYTRAELSALFAACRECGLPLVIDGARMGYGLAAPGNDCALADIAALCDMFTIGGTKVGALFGEAVVIMNPALQKDFRYIIKQRGGMLAKGRLLGIQFEALFEDGLYYEISRHAVEQAMRIREAFAAKGVSFRYDSMTNQQFPILSHDVLARLEKKYAFSHWETLDATRSAVRFCTSWATRPEHVSALLEDIAML